MRTELSIFGQWLTERCVQYRSELLAVCGDDKLELPTVKRKFGQFEAFSECLSAFTDLVKNHETFRKERLDDPGPDDSDAVEPSSGG